jgi:hypothetical protein
LQEVKVTAFPPKGDFMSSKGMNHMPEGGLVKAKYGYTKRSIRVEGEDIESRKLGMMGDMTRHIEVIRDKKGVEYYRVEDVKDAAGEDWSTPIEETDEPVIKLKKNSVLHYTTRAGAEAILAKAGTRQARAVQQLMD